MATLTTTTTTTTTKTFKPEEEIRKLLNSLDPEENNIDKITEITHKCLLIMSVRDTAEIINSREKTEDNEEEKMKLFDEIVQKCYSIKIESMRKKLLK